MIYLFSGKVGPFPEGSYLEDVADVLDSVPCGSMVFYLGKEWVPVLRQEYYKIGYGEYFGYIGKSDEIMFYDLGEDDSNESQTL